MTKQTPLTMEQIEILLKVYYIGNCTKIASMGNMSLNQIVYIRNNALKFVRLSCPKSYLSGEDFRSNVVLQSMAEFCHMSEQALYDLYSGHIRKGLKGEYGRLWQRIKPNTIPNPYHLVEFIYDKYERDILATI